MEVGVMPFFMEPIHVELSIQCLTCRTKDVYFLCLKYCGSTSSEKAWRFLMTNPSPESLQATMSELSSLFLNFLLLLAFRRSPE